MEKEIIKFEELDISENTKRALKEIKYNEMTEIQKQSIPYILNGEDVIGQSQTGTGKTASFGIPMIEKIDKTSRETQSIILCPTRELAIQVAHSIRRFLKYNDSIKCVPIYGGEPIERQIRELKKGVQIIIGTPGRVMDHLRRKTIKLNQVKMVILDEADEMLNMGFEEDIETILKYVPEERQTVLFSATMNKRILEISKKYLKEPKNIKIKSKELTVERIKQLAMEVKAKMKDETVCRILDIEQPQKAIIFCNTKKKVDELIDELKTRNYKAEALHGDIKQSQRDRIMKKLKQGDVKILVATDVAARGIDVRGVELVINYDIPQELEYYVHRIGRTGRNGKTGTAYTFYIGREKIKVKEIEKYANTNINYVNIPSLEEVEKTKVVKNMEKIEEIIKKNKFKNTEVLDKLLEKKYSVFDVAKALLTLIARKESGLDFEYDYTPDERGNVKLFFNVGKKDKIKVKDIIGCIRANTALTNDDIGKVNLLDNFTFVYIPANYVTEVIKNVRGKVMKNKTINIEIAKN